MLKGISTIFPCENENTYFISYLKEGKIICPNKGKLYDKYCNLKRNILKINNVHKRKHTECVEQLEELNEG